MVVGDMGVEEDCDRLVQTAVEQLGGVDMLIINAAYSYPPVWFTADENLVCTIYNIKVNFLFPSIPYSAYISRILNLANSTNLEVVTKIKF